MHSLFGGRETIISPLPFIIMVTFSGAWASHGGPIGTAYQIRGRSPHPLPAERCKGQPRKGVGDRIGRQPYCHTLVGTSICFSPFLKGEMLSFFFFLCFFVSGSLSLAVFSRSSRLRVVA